MLNYGLRVIQKREPKTGLSRNHIINSYADGERHLPSATQTPYGSCTRCGQVGPLVPPSQLSPKGGTHGRATGDHREEREVYGLGVRPSYLPRSAWHSPLLSRKGRNGRGTAATRPRRLGDSLDPHRLRSISHSMDLGLHRSLPNCRHGQGGQCRTTQGGLTTA